MSQLEAVRLEAEDKDKERASAANVVGRRLLDARTILLFGDINQRRAEAVVAQLLALDADGDAPIRLFINSQGGHVESGDSIHDAVRFVGAPVYAIGTGWVASAGAHIYLAAEKEHRYSLPNTRFMLHQPSGGVGGQYSDIEIEVNELVKMRERINRIIAERTGQPYEKIVKDTDRNHWMNAEEARDYGLVGSIVRSVKDLG